MNNEIAAPLEFATLMITLEGETGDLPDQTQYDIADEEVRRIASEAVQAGLPGITAQAVDFTDFVVDRMPARDGLGNRIHLRPKTAFGQ